MSSHENGCLNSYLNTNASSYFKYLKRDTLVTNMGKCIEIGTENPGPGEIGQMYSFWCAVCGYSSPTKEGCSNHLSDKHSGQPERLLEMKSEKN